MNKLIGKITNPSVLCGRQLFAFGPDNGFGLNVYSMHTTHMLSREGREGREGKKGGRGGRDGGTENETKKCRKEGNSRERNDKSINII